MRPPLHPGTHKKLLEHRAQRLLQRTPQVYYTRVQEDHDVFDCIPQSWCFYGCVVFAILFIGPLVYFLARET